MDNETLASLRKLIAYLWDDEERHAEELGMPENHIFEHIQRLQNWLDQQVHN
jgi:biotin operon repressor